MAAAPTQLSEWELETSGILRGLRSRDPYDIYFAVVGIEETGRIELLPKLVPLFRSRYLDVRIAAIRAVGALGLNECAFFAATVLPMLADRSASVRYEAAKALGRLAHIAAFEPLIALAEADAHQDVRAHAAQSARLIAGCPEPGDEVEEPRVVSFNPFRLAGL
jgi:HEAT repeat protein